MLAAVDEGRSPGLAEESGGVAKAASDRSEHPFSRALEVLLALFVVATVIHWVREMDGAWFYLDDWRLAQRAQAADGLLVPFNGHASVLIVAIYRGLLGVFGFNYLPFAATAVATRAAVSIAIYLRARSALGTPVAAGLAVSMLWFVGMELDVATLNHYQVMVAAVAVAYLIDRPSSPQSDRLLALTVFVALISAGGGVAVLAAALVAVACTRPGLRRSLHVAVPGALWGVWWLGDC